MTVASRQDQKEFRERLDAVLEQMRLRQTDGLAELRDLYSKHSGEYLVIGHLSWAEAQAGNHEESIRLCREFLAITPDDAVMKTRIADRLVNLGRLDEAEAVYRKTLDEHPDSMDARMGVRYLTWLGRKREKDTAPEPVYISGKPAQTETQRRNLALNAGERRRGRLRLRSLPPRLYLESTTKCNFFCRTCTKGYGAYYAEDLHEDVREKVRREVMPANTRISITGFGEPTLSGDFDEILGMAVGNGSKVCFVTNASLLNFERLEKITSNPVDIAISFDGATRETFEEIRAGASFDLIIEKLAMIKKLRDIYLSQFSSCFNLNFVALQKNIHELADVVRIAHRYGINHVHVEDYAFNFNDFDRESLRYSPESANELLTSAKAVADELGVRLDLPPFYAAEPPAGRAATLWQKLRRTRRIFPARRRFPRKCSSPWTEPYIRTDGTVKPCCASEQYMGDLKLHSFRRIWNGWRYRLLRWRIHGVAPPLRCRLCYVSWGINGGNAANVMAREGLLLKAWYWCERRFEVVGHRLRTWRRRQTRADAPEVKQVPNYEMGKPMGGRREVAD